MATTVEAFKIGLMKDSLFYKDIVITPCRRMNEVASRALRFIRLEEDKEIKKRINPLKFYDNPDRKADSSV